MAQRNAFDSPASVEAVDGEVAIVGPGRLGVSLTPDAARETSRRLQDRATEAEEQTPDSPPR
jgi:hypothetical protein